MIKTNTQWVIAIIITTILHYSVLILFLSHLFDPNDRFEMYLALLPYTILLLYIVNGFPKWFRKYKTKKKLRLEREIAYKEFLEKNKELIEVRNGIKMKLDKLHEDVSKGINQDKSYMIVEYTKYIIGIDQDLSERFSTEYKNRQTSNN